MDLQRHSRAATGYVGPPALLKVLQMPVEPVERVSQMKVHQCGVAFEEDRSGAEIVPGFCMLQVPTAIFAKSLKVRLPALELALMMTG